MRLISPQMAPMSAQAKLQSSITTPGPGSEISLRRTFRPSTAFSHRDFLLCGHLRERRHLECGLPCFATLRSREVPRPGVSMSSLEPELGDVDADGPGWRYRFRPRPAADLSLPLDEMRDETDDAGKQIGDVVALSSRLAPGAWEWSRPHWFARHLSTPGRNLPTWLPALIGFRSRRGGI